jgi:aa3 type cytochrome c oxidase subunit IV
MIMLTTMDAETQRHRQTWLGFCRFVRIMTVVIVLILVGMAIFLLERLARPVIGPRPRSARH